jgi:hypothetical protein
MRHRLQSMFVEERSCNRRLHSGEVIPRMPIDVHVATLASTRWYVHCGCLRPITGSTRTPAGLCANTLCGRYIRSSSLQRQVTSQDHMDLGLSSRGPLVRTQMVIRFAGWRIRRNPVPRAARGQAMVMQTWRCPWALLSWKSGSPGVFGPRFSNRFPGTSTHQYRRAVGSCS